LRFVVDASVELVVATELRKAGHDAVHIVERQPRALQTLMPSR
jgi:hypothetical protein